MKLSLATVSILLACHQAKARPDEEAAAPPSLRAAKKTNPRELTIVHDGFDMHGRVLLTKNHRDLGKIDVSSLESAQADAKVFLEGTDNHGRRLERNAFPNNGDKFIPKNNKNPHHLRFVQEHNGIEIEGAAVMVHTDADGRVEGVNGEIVSTSKLSTTPNIGAGRAIQNALQQSRVPEAAYNDCSPPRLTIVRDPKDGSGHLAWSTECRYDEKLRDGSYKPFKDQIFATASGDTAGLVTLFPKIYTRTSDPRPNQKGTTSLLRKKRDSSTLKGKARRVESVPRKPVEKGQRRLALSVNTQDCNQKTKNCSTVSTSSSAINTGDLAIDSAHNFAVATYNYYLQNHGRDSINDAGMTLISRVHYDRNYNNAFWDGRQMTYGDGDGVTFVPLSQDADVVAHELTHGVTERSSGLIYQNESGALNEALSDIFGALVDRQEGASGADIWLLGENIYTPGTPGDALRDMACPSCAGDYDYYPTRYTGTSDNGGVHWNSGIANLAFVLLVDGGKHPKGRTPLVDVPGIGFEAAADIFYKANIGCLTSGSNFAAARYCTADVHGGSNAAAVNAAWDAVGVSNDPPPPPNNPITLAGNTVSSESASAGNVQSYMLGTPVTGKLKQGETVTCSTAANNGDADLYLRFGAEAETNPNSSVNECGSYSSTSNESCTTRAASDDDTMFYATLHAYAGYTGLTVQCTVNTGGGPTSCSLEPAGASCIANTECCSNSCKGKPGSKTCK